MVRQGFQNFSQDRPHPKAQTRRDTVHQSESSQSHVSIDYYLKKKKKTLEKITNSNPSTHIGILEDEVQQEKRIERIQYVENKTDNSGTFEKRVLVRSQK